MSAPDLSPVGDNGFGINAEADRRDTGVAFAWVAGLITLVLVVGFIVWLAHDHAAPVAPLVEMRR